MYYSIHFRKWTSCGFKDNCLSKKNHLNNFVKQSFFNDEFHPFWFHPCSHNKIFYHVILDFILRGKEYSNNKLSMSPKYSLNNLSCSCSHVHEIMLLHKTNGLSISCFFHLYYTHLIVNILLILFINALLFNKHFHDTIIISMSIKASKIFIITHIYSKVFSF